MQLEVERHNLCASSSIPDSPLSAASPRSSRGFTIAGKPGSYIRLRVPSTPLLSPTLRSTDTSPSGSPSLIWQLGSRATSFTASSFPHATKVHGRSSSWVVQRYRSPWIPRLRSTTFSAQTFNPTGEEVRSAKLSPTESTFSFAGYTQSPSTSFPSFSSPIPVEISRG